MAPGRERGYERSGKWGSETDANPMYDPEANVW